jgi:hypothetical protein
MHIAQDDTPYTASTLNAELSSSLRTLARDNDPGDALPVTRTRTFEEWFDSLTPRQHKRLSTVMLQSGLDSHYAVWQQYFTATQAQ